MIHIFSGDRWADNVVIVNHCSRLLVDGAHQMRQHNGKLSTCTHVYAHVSCFLLLMRVDTWAGEQFLQTTFSRLTNF